MTLTKGSRNVTTSTFPLIAGALGFVVFEQPPYVVDTI